MRAALRDQERQRSGKAMRPQAALVLILGAVACWLILVLGRVPYVGYVGVGVGVVVGVIAVWCVLGVVFTSPLVPWGNAVRDRCPRCGQRTLREDQASHAEHIGPRVRVVGGVVTHCTAGDCEHVAVREITVIRPFE